MEFVVATEDFRNCGVSVKKGEVLRISEYNSIWDGNTVEEVIGFRGSFVGHLVDLKDNLTPLKTSVKGVPEIKESIKTIEKYIEVTVEQLSSIYKELIVKDDSENTLRMCIATSDCEIRFSHNYDVFENTKYFKGDLMECETDGLYSVRGNYSFWIKNNDARIAKQSLKEVRMNSIEFRKQEEKIVSLLDLRLLLERNKYAYKSLL